MRPTHRVLLGFLMARLVFGAVFLAGAVARWPVPWYFPLTHRWVFAASVDGLAMDWYGRSLLSLTSGALAGGCAYALAGMPRVGAAMARKGFVLGVANLGALLLLQDVLFYVFYMVIRHPTAEPLPRWYCPQ